MAIILDECGYPKTEFLTRTYCTGCGDLFREDESDWASLCQSCGEAEDDQEDWECAYPGKCLMPDPFHHRSECYTVEDAEAYYAEGKD